MRAPQIALQFDGTGTGDLGAEDLSHRYLWGPAVDQILADEQVHWDAGQQQYVTDELLWLLCDHLGTVRDLIDNAGTVRIHRLYDAFGNITSDQLRNAANEVVTPGQPGALIELLAFTARPFDAATGLQNNLHRWYDASTGRWLSEDPIGFSGSDANVYRYLANSPTPHTDSKGLASQNTDWLFDFGNNRRIAYVSRIAIGNGKNGVFVVRFQAKYEPIAWGGASSLTDVHRLEAAVEYTVRPEQEATLVKLIPVVKYSLPAMAKKNLKPVMSDGGWWIAQADGSVPLGEGTKRPMYSGKAYTGGATTARDKFSVSTENNSQSLLYQVLMVAVDLSKKKPCLIDTIRFDYQLVKGRHKGTGKTIFGLRTTVHGKLTEKGKSPLPLDKYETGINMTEDAREAIKKWHAFYFK